MCIPATPTPEMVPDISLPSASTVSLRLFIGDGYSAAGAVFSGLPADNKTGLESEHSAVEKTGINTAVKITLRIVLQKGFMFPPIFVFLLTFYLKRK
jgi:hypothetical protein